MCCDGQPAHWLPRDDRKLTDEAEKQTHHTVSKAGMLHCSLITSANQVSKLDEHWQQARDSTHTRTGSLTFSTPNIFSIC